MSDNPYRLPRTVVPSQYRLVLEPDLDAATFSGTVSIDVMAGEAADAVTLNAIELTIDSVRISGTEVSFHLDTDTERLIVDAPLGSGQAAVIDSSGSRPVRRSSLM